MNKVTNKDYFAYFSYGFGQCFSFGIVGTFIMFFYTEILGISAVAASIIFVIARVWDAVNDPIIAGSMDTRVTKQGKFRGYLKIIPIFTVISTILCFISPDFSMTGKVIYAAVTYLIWGTVYTISDIPFWSLSAVMTEKAEERTKFVTMANVGVFAGIGLAGILVPPLVGVFKDKDPSIAYLMAVIIIMAMGYGFMMYGYAHTKERIQHSTSEKNTKKDVINSLKNNPHMFKVLLIFFFNIFMNVIQNIINYFFVYNMKDANLMVIFGFIGTASALGFFFIPVLAKKYMKKNILSVILIIDIVVRGIFFLCGYQNVVIVMLMLTVTQFLYSATGPLISAMLSETIEHSEVKTGKRCEAITFSGQTFTGKLSVALAGAVAGLILTFIEYTPNVEQTSATLNGLFFVISVLPAFGSLIRLIILRTYKYTEVEYNENLKILAQRKKVS